MGKRSHCLANEFDLAYFNSKQARFQVIFITSIIKTGALYRALKYGF